MQTVLPKPHADLGLGYLVGLRANIPKDLSEQLRLVGLTHIIAVSGYNLTVIVQSMRKVLAKRSAYQAVFFTSLLLIGFLLVAGGSAPITRAAVVCGFSLLAWYYGRDVKPHILLLLSGGLTAFFNPLYVWGDPGWYLSFLAFAGVLILAPLITSYFYKAGQPGTIMQILIETLCAQAATIPYTLYLFGSVSIIAPLANVLALPVIPVIMLLVFVTGIIGMFLPGVGAIVGMVPTALLTLQIWIIEKLSQVSFASTEVSISLINMLTLFLFLVVLVLVLSKIVTKREGGVMAEINKNMV